MTPAAVAQLASKQADLRNDEVFDRLFDRAKHSHVHQNGLHVTCGCEYCAALRRYTAVKLIHHRYLKRLSWDHNYYIEPGWTLESDLNSREVAIASFRQEKNQILNQSKL